MRYVVILYFVISGLIFGWKGIRVVIVGAHFGEPVTWMYRKEILAASAAGDTQKKEELESGFRRFEAQLAKVSRESFDAGVLLGAACMVHLVIALILLLRLRISDLRRFPRNKKEPNQPLEPTRGTGP